MKNHTILFFDGYCALCSFAVNAVLRLKIQPPVYFAPLQGQTASEKLPLTFTKGNLSTVVLLNPNGTILTKSDVIFSILRLKGFPLNIFLILKCLPLAIRNKCYDLIANNRFRFFKKREACYLPSSKYSELFLK